MNRKISLRSSALAAICMSAALLLPGTARARDQIQIVGSSTVYPFATMVAEEFGRSSKFKAPVIESTGTGGGFKLFCSGVGDRFADISNASRRIKKTEVDTCAANGVTEITEIKVGYDGIVLANARSAKPMSLTLKDIFMALARQVPGKDGTMVDNPYQTWKEVNADLPDMKIRVLGPPPTSGTRDAFAELAMEGGCKAIPELKELVKKDEKQLKPVCHGIREDGAYVEAGENDNLIVQKLVADPQSLGVFGYSFLDQNQDQLQGSVVGGITPTFENIASGSYPVSRPLFIYIKKAHLGMVPGIAEYVAEFSSERAWGRDGYLAERGLIPMPDEERKKFAEDAKTMRKLEF
ncbi:MAG: PstS family phosphate ABC transporter substrate-binding protein [Magnetococcales bacterium]|nr:PstS family phosphate ABC transporter substrate-binding protein [Magnetococcales bacterium]MBF0149095.1 PstS family phosphate ABC transporter substrate-binding protein [Magnetococcales bacterium]MBF0630229.1 PstS family phosphate ABC transporter substrate-binding protein [Magnetococcales bacterium]